MKDLCQEAADEYAFGTRFKERPSVEDFYGDTAESYGPDCTYVHSYTGDTWQLRHGFTTHDKKGRPVKEKKDLRHKDGWFQAKWICIKYAPSIKGLNGEAI